MNAKLLAVGAFVIPAIGMIAAVAAWNASGPPDPPAGSDGVEQRAPAPGPGRGARWRDAEPARRTEGGCAASPGGCRGDDAPLPSTPALRRIGREVRDALQAPAPAVPPAPPVAFVAPAPVLAPVPGPAPTPAPAAGTGHHRRGPCATPDCGRRPEPAPAPGVASLPAGAGGSIPHTRRPSAAAPAGPDEDVAGSEPAGRAPAPGAAPHRHGAHHPDRGRVVDRERAVGQDQILGQDRIVSQDQIFGQEVVLYPAPPLDLDAGHERPVGVLGGPILAPVPLLDGPPVVEPPAAVVDVLPALPAEPGACCAEAPAQPPSPIQIIEDILAPQPPQCDEVPGE